MLPSRGAVAFGVINVFALAGFAALLWAFSGPSTASGCDVNCGPASLVVDVIVAGVSVAFWLLAMIVDVAVLIGGRPSRRLGGAGAAVQLVPVAILVAMAWIER
jgi:hypothetical protein